MIHLINKTLFDARASVSGNYDWNLIKPIVELVQFRYVQDITGTDLYQALQTKVEAYVNSSTPIGSDYKNLLDEYIIPCMVWHIQAEMLISAKFRVTPAGVMEAAPEGANPVSTDDLKWVIEEYRNNAESYSQKAIDHIIQNSTLFPEYTTNQTLDKTKPLGTAYTSPFYTRNKRRFYRNDEGPLHD